VAADSSPAKLLADSVNVGAGGAICPEERLVLERDQRLVVRISGAGGRTGAQEGAANRTGLAASARRASPLY